MKHLVALLLLSFASYGYSQDAPKTYNPCQKLDTNTIKQLLIGTWVDTKDPSHIMVITTDSVEETIIVTMGSDTRTNESYWNYQLVDNIFSSDDVTCYSLREYKEGYNHHVDNSINSLDKNYLLFGAAGKIVFKRK
jgi:hypothetical protein